MKDSAAVAEVRTDIEGAVGYLVVSNPRKHNAMTLDMWRAFAAGIAALDAHPSVRVIVVRGDGDTAFVSGADISQFEGMRTTADDQTTYDQVAEEAYAAPGRAGKPVIACIRGICMGGGLGLAAACDLRICSTDARFRMPAARLGLGYSVEGVKHFVALIGPQNVLDLFMSARSFGSDDALRMGFVTAVEAPEQLHERVAAIASAIAQNAPLTLRAVKLAVRAAHLRTEGSITAAQDAIGACVSSADYLEGQRAFREKRLPSFTGH